MSGRDGLVTKLRSKHLKANFRAKLIKKRFFKLLNLTVGISLYHCNTRVLIFPVEITLEQKIPRVGSKIGGIILG